MILLRHGQSEFNLHFGAMRRDPGIIDPALTELGHAQATAAITALAGQPVDRVITSPYTRTLQTAAPIARALGVPVVINPVVRERYGFACDIGTPRSALSEAWPDQDFSELSEIWWPSDEEPVSHVADRAARFRAAMAAEAGWETTLVVTHWYFIRCMTGESVPNGQWLRWDPNHPPPPHAPA